MNFPIVINAVSIVVGIFLLSLGISLLFDALREYRLVRGALDDIIGDNLFGSDYEIEKIKLTDVEIVGDGWFRVLVSAHHKEINGNKTSAIVYLNPKERCIFVAGYY